MTQLE